MIRLSVAGNAPNRSPSILGQTVYLRGGSTELLEDELGLALHAWATNQGHGADYRFQRISPPPPPADEPDEVYARPGLTEAEARLVIGETRRSKISTIVSRVEVDGAGREGDAQAAGFDVSEDVAASKTKAGLLVGLIQELTTPRVRT